MLAESLAAEAAREIERLLGADATQTLGDFEAAETAVRTAVLAVAARFVAERLKTPTTVTSTPPACPAGADTRPATPAGVQRRSARPWAP